MNIAVTRKIYESVIREYKKSCYKEDRDYGDYLDRFFNSKDDVDGLSFEERAQKLPMPFGTFKEVAG